MKLYYRIPRTRHTIKIDLLLSDEPGLETPSSLRPSHFEYINEIPIAPLYFVLYHKLMGWDTRLDSGESWKEEKANNVDYHDILDLCDILFEEDVKPLSKTHMGKLYSENLKARADLFVEIYGRSARNKFRRIGF